MTDVPEIPTRRKVLYLAVLLGLTLVAGEAAVRLRAWAKYGRASPGVRDAMLTYNEAWGLDVPTPGYEVKGANIHIKINSLGFRGAEFSREKPSGTFRIVCLGASTTFSAEATSNDAIWTYLLQKQLQADHPSVRIEVINAAVAGYVAADNLKNLTHRVLPLDPDLVIYYELNNEIVRDTRELAASRGEVEGRSQAMAALARHSLLADLVEKNLAILFRGQSEQPRIDDVPANLPTRFIGVLDQMRALLAERNVPMVLSTFSVKYRRDQDRPTQIANADVAFFYMPWMSIDGMLNAMDLYNKAVLDFGARAGLQVVDDRFAIPADAAHFADCMHLTDAGNAAMARRFYKALTEAGTVDRLLQRPTGAFRGGET